MNPQRTFEVRLVLPAISGLELVAAETAASLACHGGADESTASDIRLAVIEGCINAIEHAYSNAQTSNCAPCEVDLRFLLVPAESDPERPAHLTVRIRDTGRGFDLGSYEEPNLEKKLHSPRKRGWGLRLIRGFMDHVHVDSGSGGTTIEMTKYLASTRG